MATCALCADVDANESSPLPVDVTKPSPSGSGFIRVICPRCGTYDLETDLEAIRFGEEMGLRLSGVVAEQEDLRTLGTSAPVPVVASTDYRDLAEGALCPTNASGYFDAVLSHVASICRYPGRSTGQRQLARLAARSFLPQTAYRFVARQLKEQRLLEVRNEDVLRFDSALTPDGWARVDAAKRKTRQRDRAFVAMKFGEDTKESYHAAIRPALIAAGYSPPFRVDDPEHDTRAELSGSSQKIDDRILAEIRRSRFVVVEVTGNRTSVYFEAGFAEGLGIPIVWCCRKGSETDMAFDTRQNAHILWESVDDLRNQLLDKIRRHGWDIQALGSPSSD